MPVKTGAFFGLSDGIGQYDCRSESVNSMLILTTSMKRAFNPITPISFDERCRELAIDEQPIFGVPICRRYLTLESELIAPRPAMFRHRWWYLRAIRRIVPGAFSARLEESQYLTIHTFRGLHATHPPVQALRQLSFGNAPSDPI